MEKNITAHYLNSASTARACIDNLKKNMSKMTLLQARWIQYLTLTGCSLRATAGNFYERYAPLSDGSYMYHRSEFPYMGFGGNQFDGCCLREEALEVLKAHGVKPYFNVDGNAIGYDEDSYEKFKKANRYK